MSCTREKIVAQAQAWVGLNEADGSHKQIVDIYNGHKPLAGGYKLKYTDAWCAGFASAVAIACGATDIIPTEVGCGRYIELFKKKGIWVENDSHVPAPGDYIFENRVITVIEGNYANSVKRRTIEVNGRYIRGYGVPKYDAEPIEKEPATVYYSVRLPRLANGSNGSSVKALQILLIGYKYSCGGAGADGKFGAATDAAVRRFQKAQGLTVDGIVGPATWAKLLGV